MPSTAKVTKLRQRSFSGKLDGNRGQGRLTNAELRTREYLKSTEIDRLIQRLEKQVQDMDYAMRR